jgi:hypothetical protein
LSVFAIQTNSAIIGRDIPSPPLIAGSGAHNPTVVIYRQLGLSRTRASPYPVIYHCATLIEWHSMLKVTIKYSDYSECLISGDTTRHAVSQQIPD